MFIFLPHSGKYLVVPTTTGIKLKQSVAAQKEGELNGAHHAAAAIVPLVRENDAGEMVFTGECLYVTIIIFHLSCGTVAILSFASSKIFLPSEYVCNVLLTLMPFHSTI